VNDEEHIFGRGILAALQITAMGLCLCICALMYIEDRASLPPRMCLEAGK
jgi:hypothetical protein